MAEATRIRLKAVRMRRQLVNNHHRSKMHRPRQMKEQVAAEMAEQTVQEERRTEHKLHRDNDHCVYLFYGLYFEPCLKVVAAILGAFGRKSKC